MTFGQIERIIDAKLPSSAYKYRSWWSNNPSNSTITPAWLNAGYKTANVKIEDRKLVFRRTMAGDLPSETGGGEQIQESVETAVGTGFSSHVFGSLKGTVSIAPGTELASPIEEEWDAGAASFRS